MLVLIASDSARDDVEDIGEADEHMSSGVGGEVKIDP